MQATEGAPYEMFLPRMTKAADDKRPRVLYQKEISGKPSVHMRGGVVLWTAGRELCGAGVWKSVITGGKVERVSADVVKRAYGYR
jgi:hypothetical protein